jgi:integrase
MGKILQLKRVRVETEETSELCRGITDWLKTRPANTAKQYLRLARAWSLYLGAEFSDKAAQPLWIAAKYGQVTRWVNQVKQGKAQRGRATEASGDGLVSMGTIKHKVIVMKSIYDQLIAQGLIEHNPFARMTLELKRHATGDRRPYDRLPDNAVKALLSFRPKDREQVRDLAIMHLLFGAALRRSEVVGVRICDVLMTAEGTTYLRLTKTKSQKVQTVALPDWVARKVENLREQRLKEGANEKDPLVVVYRKNGRLSSMSVESLYRLFKRYCKQYHIDPRYSPHCARVTAITKLLDQGCTHREVKELSRHGSVAMVERYDRKRVELDKSASKKLRY